MEWSLSNGLRVLLLEDHSSPLVAVQVWYHVGSADEPAGRHGFAHLFEHMMFRGTDRLGPTDHFDLIHGVGGNCNAFTSFDETCYHETLPAQQLELALWLESERMAFLTVDGSGFSTERKVVEEERRLDLNLPYGELADKGPPLIFGQHPYGHDPLGTFRDLRQAAPAEVHAWWVQRYTPNNATLVVVGDVNADRVRQLSERYFGWIPAVAGSRQPVPELMPWEAPQELVVNLANAPAPAVGIVWRTPAEGQPDALALDVLALILGGDARATVTGGANSSRLYGRLVTDERLAVMATAMQFGLSRGSVFGAGAVLSPLGGNVGRTLSVLRQELDRLRSEGVTTEELEKARSQMLGSFLREAQTVEGQASLIGHAAVGGAGIGELNSRLQRLHRLTPAELQRVAKLHLDPQRAITVTIPASSLWDQFSRLFFGNRKAEETAPTAFAPTTLLRGREGVVRPVELPTLPPVSPTNSAIPHVVVEERRLTNGLRVLVVPNTNSPLVEVVLALPYGSWAETKHGAAAMALGQLVKGTEAHDEKALAEELDRHGIQLSASAGLDDSQVQLSCVQDQVDRAFALMAEVVARPVFPGGAFKVAVTRANAEVRVADTTPYFVASREFQRHLFPGHPYGRRVIGEPAELAALRREDLADFWNRVAQPDQATLVIVGGLSNDRAQALAQRYFADWRKSDPEKNPPPGANLGDRAAASEAADRLSDHSTYGAPAPPPPSRPDPTHILLIDWPGADQSQICIGGLGIQNQDSEKPIASLVGSYFGGAFGSRLMKAIRVQKGATYGVRGEFEPSRFSGAFVVRTFTKTPSTADTVRIVLSEIRDLRDRPPTPEELSLHKRYFLGGAAARFETPEQVASQLAHIALNRFPLDQVQRNLARISAATAAECQRLNVRVVDPNRLLIVVVGDASTLRKDLAMIAPVTILNPDGQPAQSALPR